MMCVRWTALVTMAALVGCAPLRDRRTPVGPAPESTGAIASGEEAAAPDGEAAVADAPPPGEEAPAADPTVDPAEGGPLVSQLQQLLEDKLELEEQVRALQTRADTAEAQAERHAEEIATARTEQDALRVENERLRRLGTEREMAILEQRLLVARLQRQKLLMEVAAVERQLAGLEGEPAEPTGGN